MADFKKNITSVTTADKEKYFQLPQNFEKYVSEKDKQKNTLEHSKQRLEEQLEKRKEYVELLTKHCEALKNYEKNPNSDKAKKSVEMTKVSVDRHNLEIEIVAQKNVFVDSYIYYKEDFMKRYKNGKNKKKSVFKK